MWEQIYQNTFIPELPKIWNRNFQTFQNYMNVFYDASRGIIIKPVVTTGKVKAATGEFVTLITDNLIIRNSSTGIVGGTGEAIPTDEITLTEGLVFDSSTLNYIYKADVSVNTNEGEIVPPLTISGARNIHPRGDFTTTTGYSYYPYTTTYEKLSSGGPLVLSGGNTLDASVFETAQGGDLILQGGFAPESHPDDLATFGNVLIKGYNVSIESDQLFLKQYLSSLDSVERFIDFGTGPSDAMRIVNEDYVVEIGENGISFNDDLHPLDFEIGTNGRTVFNLDGGTEKFYFGHGFDRANITNLYKAMVTIETISSWSESDSLHTRDSLCIKNNHAGVGSGNYGGSISLSGPNDVIGGLTIRQSAIVGKQTGALQNEVGIAMFTHNGSTSNLNESFVLDHNGDLTITGSYFPASDIRLKFEKEVIENPLDKIDKISGYTYTKDGRRQAGLIANEVQEILPEAILVDDSPDKYLHLNDAAMTGLLVEAVKEQSKLIKAQAKLIEELQLKIK